MYIDSKTIISSPNLNERLRKEENQMVITMTVIVVVFLTCNIFGTVVWLLFTYNLDLCRATISYLWSTSLFLETVNSGINVIIYATLSKKFRKNFVQLFYPSFMQESTDQITSMNLQHVIAKNFPKNSNKSGSSI